MGAKLPKLLNKSKKMALRNLHLIILAIVLLLVIILIAVTSSANFFPINNETPDDFNANWKCSVDGGEYYEINLPLDVEDKVDKDITLVNTVPGELVKGATFLIRTSQQCLAVYIDNELIYTTFNSDTQQNIPSSAYHFVRLPQDAFNKTVTIKLSSSTSSFVGVLNEIQLGSKASLIFNMVGKQGGIFLAGFVLALLGIFLTIGSLFVKLNGKGSGMMFLGCFFIAAGIWLAVESRLLQLIIPYSNMLTNLSLFQLTLMPVFISLYFLSICFKRYTKAMLCVAVTAGAGSIAMFILSLINVMLPVKMLTFYIIFLGMLLIAILTLAILEYRKNKEALNSTIKGIGIFGLFALVELICFLLKIENYNNSFFLTTGLFVFCIIMFFEFISSFKKAYKNEMSVKSLKELAYTDSLTGLFNRTAFIETLAKIDLSSNKKIGVGMFDINNLKTINDENGHLLGDYTIIECSKFLKSTLIGFPIFRIGGDEFVSIMEGFNKSGLDEDMKLMCLWETSKYKNTGVQLDFAYGYAEFDKTKDKNLFDTVERADKQMYECKQKQKKQD